MFRYRVDILNGAGLRIGQYVFTDRQAALDYGDQLLGQGLYGFEVVDRDTRQVIHYGASARAVTA